ncbi:MAG: protein-glutamate O-methyltransferase CheR [Gammaproteobacteria bacterium]|nr:MAG: protein-glutamate O-methyltransferase CheR [Gammaproteobacteria bacterium]
MKNNQRLHLPPLSPKNFQQLAKVAHDYAGIVLDNNKQHFIYNRLFKRLHKLNLSDLDTYCALIATGDRHELDAFINAITTKVTYFFREKFHFDYLSEVILPHLIKTKKNTHKIRIWSAGCASGEEAYSIAMVVYDMLPQNQLWDVKILATDIDSDSLVIARKAVYAASTIEHLDREQKKRWFLKGSAQNEGMIAVRPEIKNLVHFKHLNLINSWPMRGTFDIIFCRNVAIYLSKETQQTLFNKFRNYLPIGAFLIIGQAETLYQSSDCYTLIKNSIYQRSR